MILSKEKTRELEEKIVNSTKAEIISLISRYKMYELKGGVLGRVFEKLYVNSDGISGAILVSDLEKIHHSFHTTNGGDWCRSRTGYLGKKYIIKRNRQKGSIYSVKCEGLECLKLADINVQENILAKIKNRRCVILDVPKDIQCDCKNTRKSIEDNENTNSQNIDDFQSLCKTANEAKKLHCKNCIQSGKRYDATRLGYTVPFIYGDENSKSCKGCYWFDPIEFNMVISNNFKKDD